MRCPKCHSPETKVVDSRDTNDSKEIRRRRECESCQHRFTTFERYQPPSFTVLKKDNVHEPYDREKVLSGIWRALKKRKVSETQVSDLINELEEEWVTMGKEIPSSVIGESIMKKLRDLDEVAYIRFASVYRDFQDVASFENELKELSQS